MSHTDSDHEISRAAKRVDRGGDDSPTNTGTGAAVKPELAAVQDKIQALSTTGCSCAMSHYLEFGDGQLVSLFASLGRLSKADKKTLRFG